VPDTLDGLLALPGVGRKTANIVLARAYGKNTLGVDVHVHRISNRLGLVRTKKPEKTEMALVRIVPQRYIRSLNRDFVAFGQTLCLPRKPMCGICPLNRMCRRVGVKEPCAACAYGVKN
jgi:endonuclease-3